VGTLKAKNQVCLLLMLIHKSTTCRHRSSIAATLVTGPSTAADQKVQYVGWRVDSGKLGLLNLALRNQQGSSAAQKDALQ
jgi:hypothetical protein